MMNPTGKIIVGYRGILKGRINTVYKTREIYPTRAAAIKATAEWGEKKYGERTFQDLLNRRRFTLFTNPATENDPAQMSLNV